MALMTWPLTSDGAGAVTFTANDWRTFVTNLYTEGILGTGSFLVSERALGANMTLDIAAGVAVLEGDDAANQGRYLVREDSASLSAVTIGTAHASLPRIDLVGIQLNDPSEGGAAGRNCVFAVVAGTAAGTPVAPVAPDSFLVLASVLVPAAAVAIDDTDIIDLRVSAALAHQVAGTDALVNLAVESAKLGDQAVTNSKLRHSSPLSIIGRSANSTGDPADMVAGTDGHVLRRAGTFLGFGTVATDGITDGAVTTAKIADGNVTTAKIAGGAVTDVKLANNAATNTIIRDSVALSVIGRSANSTGDPADMVAGTDGHVLRRAGTFLGFGPLATAGITDGAVTTAKIADAGVTAAKLAPPLTTTVTAGSQTLYLAKLGAMVVMSYSGASASGTFTNVIPSGWRPPSGQSVSLATGQDSTSASLDSAGTIATSGLCFLSGAWSTA